MDIGGASTPRLRSRAAECRCRSLTSCEHPLDVDRRSRGRSSTAEADTICKRGVRLGLRRKHHIGSEGERRLAGSGIAAMAPWLIPCLLKSIPCTPDAHQRADGLIRHSLAFGSR